MAFYELKVKTTTRLNSKLKELQQISIQADIIRANNLQIQATEIEEV